MINCKICQKELKSWRALSYHIKLHNLTSKEYYDCFNTRSYCEVCGKPTRFVSISTGYKSACSNRCAAIFSIEKRKHTCLQKYGVDNPAKSSEIRQKISSTTKLHYKPAKNQRGGYSKQTHITKEINAAKYEKEHNCTRIGKLIQQYGQGWLTIKNSISTIHINGYTFVNNADIHKIQDYCKIKSITEDDLYKFVNNLCKAVHNTKSIIKPYELDIYVPSLKLAVEYNSTWYHSVENGCSIDYHLNKSLLCREKGIRLIHIYEFEDLDIQKQLLKDLILGIDNYPKEDFNKNNLIITVPKSTLIYTSNRGYHVYGAGKLY